MMPPVSCWLCASQEDGRRDGLCLDCHQKMDGLSFPIKGEEVDRMRCLFRMIQGAVYGAIKMAEWEAQQEESNE